MPGWRISHLPASDRRGPSTGPGPLAVAGPALGAGVLMTLSVPPWGFWPLAVAGFGLLFWRLRGLGWRARLLAGAAAGLGLFGPGIFWVNEFQNVGYIALLLLELSFVALGAVLTPPGKGRAIGFLAAVVLAEAARGAFPFGGFPLGGVALGQVGGPLAFSARIGGPLLLVGITAAAGVGLAELADRRWRVAVIAAVVIAPLVVAGAADGGTTSGGSIRVAVVQGGGPRGLRAVHSDADLVFQRHLDATALVKQPVDLILWPEDVVDVDGPLAGTSEEAVLSQLAAALDTTLVAGIVEDVGADRFRNAAAAWGPDGRAIDRYDKTHRVPFGEYVPGRALISHLVNLSLLPRDAIAGHGPGRLVTPAGRLGVMISFEVFFADRARAAVRAGGEVLLVPTNAASYKTSQVPTQELAAARLRAVETGRWVVQAGPTGYSAIIDDRGRIRTRTTLGRREVRQSVVPRRRGLTPYARVGDAPVLAAAAVLLAAGWAMTRSAARATPAGWAMTRSAPPMAEDRVTPRSWRLRRRAARATGACAPS